MQRRTSTKTQPKDASAEKLTQATKPDSSPKTSLILTPAMAGFLVTGTTLTIYSQYVTNKGAADSRAQFISWIKYLSTFIINILFAPKRTAASPSITRRAQQCMWALAVLDVVAYSLFVAGFSLSGAALSTVLFAACGQVFTALQSVTLLKRPLNTLQVVSVAVVVIGLIIRNGPQLLAALSASNSGTASGASVAEWVGLATIVASSFLFATMGTVYDVMLTEPQQPTHTDVMGTVALVGLACTSIYILGYTVPRWQQLISGPLASHGVSTGAAILMWAAFGAIFNAHALMQRLVLKGEGALGVSLVNALRGPAVSIACALLFCSPESPKECLTPWSAASAAVVAVGVGLWGAAKGSKAKVAVKKQQ